MHRLLALFLFLLPAHIASGQNDTGRHNEADTANYLSYYRSVAAAEAAIVNGEYEHAVRQYHAAFSTFPYNNPVDCYVAAQAAAYSGDTASCIQFICKGLCFGLPAGTIDTNPHLATSFKKIDPRTADSCLNVYAHAIHTAARHTVISLAKRDQSFIHALPGSLYERDGFTLKKAYRPFYDSLLAALTDLTLADGFPAQKIAGTQNGADSLFVAGPNAVFALYIFIHHGNSWEKTGPMLWKELLKGNITPQMYGVIYESGNGKEDIHTPVHYFAARPCWQKQCKKIIREQLHEIDKARWEIGLGSYAVMEKKFESMLQYRKWSRLENPKRQPFFDFQCDLSFQGRQ